MRKQLEPHPNLHALIVARPRIFTSIHLLLITDELRMQMFVVFFLMNIIYKEIDVCSILIIILKLVHTK